jgi:hypothetical protein
MYEVVEKSKKTKNRTITKSVTQKRNNISSSTKEHNNVFTNSKKTEVIQRLLVPFKSPAGIPTHDETAVMNDATTIDVLTTAAYNNTWNQLVAATQAVNPVPLAIGNFPGVSVGHFGNFLIRLQGNDDAQKAMATGYVIEDQVTNNAGLPASANAQVGVGNAIPDFVIRHNLTRGIVDITSSGQQGHVLNKDFNPAGFSYISEATYPSINFAALAGVAPAMGGHALAIAQQARQQNANGYMGHRISTLKQHLELFAVGIMAGNIQFSQAAQNVINALNALPNAQYTQIGDITPIDNLIGIVNGILPDWANQPTLSQMILDAQTKYMIAGNPVW